MAILHRHLLMVSISMGRHLHHLMASTPMDRHLHHLTEKAVLPISLTICEASTLHRKMTWKTMV
jgi:hypothetical protein